MTEVLITWESSEESSSDDGIYASGHGFDWSVLLWCDWLSDYVLTIEVASVKINSKYFGQNLTDSGSQYDHHFNP